MKEIPVNLYTWHLCRRVNTPDNNFQQSAMGLTPTDCVQRTSGLQVRRVALQGGQHASLILEHGRISKLVTPEGEVAVLQWQGKDANAACAPLALHAYV